MVTGLGVFGRYMAYGIGWIWIPTVTYPRLSRRQLLAGFEYLYSSSPGPTHPYL